MRIPAADRLLSVLGYLPVLPLLLLLFKVRRTSMFAQFNLRQGAVLFSLWAVVSVILLVVLAFIPTPENGGGAQVPVFLALFLAALLYALMILIGIVKVLLGERYRMPVVADVALALKL
ncbi:MAG: hypothetical protein ACYDBQ_00610 [Thermoplasmatota archaeon]